MKPATILLAAAVAVAVSVAATGLPALQGARASTVRALNDPARPPKRHAGLIGLSARLPVALLLGIRLIARRPRRAQLAIASVAIAVATLIATLMLRHSTVLGVKVAGNILAAARQANLDHVGNVLSIILVVIAAINVLFRRWQPSLTPSAPPHWRARSARPPDRSPAGWPAPNFFAALTAIPAAIGARRPVAEVLRSE